MFRSIENQRKHECFRKKQITNMKLCLIKPSCRVFFRYIYIFTISYMVM